MHSFKVIVSVAPNGAITMLYPGSISDKATVQQSGLLNHLTTVDLVLADKRLSDSGPCTKWCLGEYTTFSKQWDIH